ncbi:MAG TPA: hypothetical protein VL084_02520 [Thermoanaerobaculia bacterium]|nr:hypothetical protein [Thermoanaerobaculia bacterium]
MRPAVRSSAAVALALLAVSCSPPPRPSTDGYSARAVIVNDGVVESAFRIAVRGSDRRREEEGAGGAVLLLLGVKQKAYRLDPKARTYLEIPYAQATDEMLPGFPLAPGFEDRAEAEKRGITEYRRESDEVFAGNVCALWRFVDQPDAVVSPSTVYWVAPSLENLTLRMDREIPRPDGTRSRRKVELTEVKVGISPDLFVVPKGYRPAVPPH